MSCFPSRVSKISGFFDWVTLRLNIDIRSLNHTHVNCFYIVQVTTDFWALFSEAVEEFWVSKGNWVLAAATATLQTDDLIGWMRKNNCAACAARFLVTFSDLVCQTTALNFHFWGERLRELAAVNLSFFSCLYMINSFMPSEWKFCSTWPTWNNRKTLNLFQCYVFSQFPSPS